LRTDTAENFPSLEYADSFLDTIAPAKNLSIFQGPAIMVPDVSPMAHLIE
jgi:hypothetical protein